MLHARKDYNERVQDSAGKIPEDEPVFLLRGQDKFMPQVLCRYIELLTSETGSNTVVVEGTLRQLLRVINWQKKHPCKAPDMNADDLVTDD